MAKKKHYYVVMSGKGTLIHDRYERAVCCRDRYLSHAPTIIKCDTLEEAQERARDWLSMEARFYGRVAPEVIEFDRIYFVDSLPLMAAKNKEEKSCVQKN